MLGKFIAISIGLCVFQSCIINNPKPESCQIQEITIKNIQEGSSFDINFTSTTGEKYYINRGLEQGLTLNNLKNIGLNSNATLHLPKFALGGVSNHIAQLVINDSIIYTEFD